MFTFLLSSDLYPPYQLTTDPIGWDGMRYALARDPRYHGITFSVSLELTFVKRAAQYIRSVYEAAGIEGACRLTIYEYNANELRNEQVYSGRLDFTRYSTDAKGVTVPLNETGFTKKFINGDGLDVNLFAPTSQGGSTLPALAPVTVPLFSQPIVKRYEATVEPLHLRSNSSYVTDGKSRFQTLYFGAGRPQVDEFGLGILANLVIPIETGGPEAVSILRPKESGDYTLSFSFLTELNIKQGLKPILGPTPLFHAAEASYYLRVGNEEPVLLEAFAVSGQASDVKRSVTLTHTGTYALTPETPIYVYAVLHVFDIEYDQLAGLGYSFEVYQDVLRGSFFKLLATTTTPATTAAGLLVYDVLARCVGSLTDAPAAFYSEYFGRTDSAPAYAVDGPGALRLITSSWLIRNFPLSEKPFFTSFRDAFDSLDATDCLGCGIELRQGRQVVRVEQRGYFYQPTEVLQLHAVEGLKKSVAADRFYNAAEFGYQKWSSSSANGLHEINGTRAYTLPITAQKATYTALSKYVAAGYLLEETRRDQYQATSGQESRGDGDAYLICLQRTAEGFEAERSQPFTLVQGPLTPSATYNLRLSPGRMLRRHGAWLRAGLLRQDNRQLTRGVVEGSDVLTSQLASETEPLREDRDVPVSELPAALYQPELYEFTTTLRPSELQRLYAQPYGLVSFPNVGGGLLSGFVLKLEVAPRTHLCTLQLLRYA